MHSVPHLLTHPNNPEYNLDEAEIFLIKEAVELIELEQYSYCLFAIWNCIVTNLQRRIENFGMNNFLTMVEDDTLYIKEGHNLKERWLNINEFKLIDYAQKLNLISHTTHDLITALYWMKTHTKNQKELSVEEIYSLLFLLEKNLFLQPFKNDQRAPYTFEQNLTEHKRRKKDKQHSESVNSSTYNELLLKSKINPFTQTKENEDTIATQLNRYI